MSKKKDANVGYGRPPTHSRFKPGRSGNPKGRPKGAISYLACVRRELEQKITVTEGGRQKRIKKQEAVAKRLVEKALKGDPQALRSVAEIDRSFLASLEKETASHEPALLAAELTPSDEAILNAFLAQNRSVPDQGTGSSQNSNVIRTRSRPAPVNDRGAGSDNEE